VPALAIPEKEARGRRRTLGDDGDLSKVKNYAVGKPDALQESSQAEG